MSETNHPTYDFAGKQVLITGGSRGIGAATVRHFAQAGATVLFNYGGSKDAAEALASDTGAHTFQADLATQAGIEDVAAAVDEKLGGKLDVLINNAGVYVAQPLDQMSVDDFLRQQKINVEAPILLTKHLLGKINAGGRIINIGSVVGDRAPFPGSGVYGSTKAAIQLFTRGLAREVGEKKITANVIQPGPIDTDMNPDSPDNPGADMIKPMTALNRYGQADEIASVATFLASDAASYITGSAITVDGGMNA